MGGGQSPGSVRRKWDGLPDGDRAGRRGQKRRRAAFNSFLFQPAGVRCRSTTSSLPVPGPLLVPEGSPLSYGVAWVGQST